MELLVHHDDLIERNGRKIARFYLDVRTPERNRLAESIGSADELDDAEKDLERSAEYVEELEKQLEEANDERDAAIKERDDLQTEVEALNAREHVYQQVLTEAGLMPKVEEMLEATAADLVDELTSLRWQAAETASDWDRLNEENQSLLEELQAARKTIRTYEELTEGMILSVNQRQLGELAA